MLIVDPVMLTPCSEVEAPEIDIAPDDELMMIPLRWALPEPERVMLPIARMFPVGVIVVPPLMINVPAEFKVPVPV